MGIFDKAVVPASNPHRHVRPEDQTGFKTKDARLDRREEAQRRARERKEKQ